MPRPKNKPDLIAQGEQNYTKLDQYLASLPEESLKKAFPEGYLNRNVRDVIAHLHHWHLLFMGWYSAGLQGEKPAIPAEGYTWKTLPEFNRMIRDKYADMELSTARKKLSETHRKMINLAESHSEEELFEKKRYAWTGTTSLAAYMISATSSHYDWATKLIKKCLKN